MTVTLVYLCLTLWCFAIRATQGLSWTDIRPMNMVVMHSENGRPVVFNLESEVVDTDTLKGGDAAMERIFGGTVAQPKAFPYQVGMMLQRNEGLYWCGGSLISDEFVLTAAHCVDRANRALVFLGAYEIRNRDEGCQRRIEVTKENFTIHPEWDPKGLMNDIALVKMPQPIIFSEHVQPIPLPRRSYEYKDFSDKLAIASGWGRYATGVHAISNVLRYVKLKIIRDNDCYRSFPLSFKSTNICTSGMRARSTCHGDSGGPLVVRKKSTKTRVLVGITSFGSIFGCDKGYPAAYTKVVSYLDWIFDETGIDPNADELEFGEDDEDEESGDSDKFVIIK